MSCYIFERDKYSRVIGVFYIVKEKDMTSCVEKHLRNCGIIIEHMTASTEYDRFNKHLKKTYTTYWFEVCKRSGVDVYSYNLQCIMKDMAEVNWEHHYRDDMSNNNYHMFFIVGYNEKLEPVTLYIQPHLSSIHEENDWLSSKKPQLISLEVLCHKAGENGWICKDEKQDKLYFIGMPYRNGSFSRAGELVCREGHSCTLEQVYFPKKKLWSEIYLVRDSQNRIIFYNDMGENILIDNM